MPLQERAWLNSSQDALMYEGRTVFSQLLDHLPRHTFRRLVKHYRGDHRVRRFTCWDQFLAMVFAQLTYRESLRDIEACLGAIPERLYHLGFRCPSVSRTTLADANEKRDWRIYADFAQGLIDEARRLYAGESLGLVLDQTVYALDATIIELCLAVFPWARYQRTKGAIKLHTLLDLHGRIPTFVRITPAAVHEVNLLDELVPEPGSIYVMDRGYTDFLRLYRWHQAQAFFVIRGKKDLHFRCRYSHPSDRPNGLICDQTILLKGPKTSLRYPEPLRRIRVRDPESGQQIILLTNHFQLSAKTIAELYRRRWHVELFFKWIKQHLRIKAFYGTSVNAVKSQIWIAISVYVLVAIVKKRLGLERDLYTLLQILSVILLEKTELSCALGSPSGILADDPSRNQLLLFDF
jgi:IS4 transposase